MSVRPTRRIAAAFLATASLLAGVVVSIAAEPARAASDPPPVVTSISPSVAFPGSVVHVLGSNLIAFCNGSFGVTTVRFGSVEADVSSVTSGDVTLTVPSGPAPGTNHDVIVSTCAGTSTATAASRFTYSVPPAPVVTSLSPSSAFPGSVLDVLGSNMTAFCNGSFGVPLVRFGSVSADVSSVTSGDVTVTVPSGPASGTTVDVIVSTCAGVSVTSPGSKFTYIVPAAPVVTSLSPSSAFSGSVVHVLGSNFVVSCGVGLGGTPSARFGNVSADVTAASSNDVTVRVPSGPARGTVVDVVVSTCAGASAATAGSKFTYAVPPPPVITSISLPTALAGSVVHVLGSNLTAVCEGGVGSEPSARFGSVSANVINSNENDFTVTVPSGPARGTTVDVVIPTCAGTSAATAASKFTYAVPPKPVITSISPAGRHAGQTVHILGSNLIAVCEGGVGGEASAQFGHVSAEDVIGDSSDLTVTLPSGFTSGMVVGVVVPTCAGENSPYSYTYGGGPVITGLSPSTGHGGQRIEILGTNLFAQCSGGHGAVSVTFNGVAADLPAGASTAERMPVIVPDAFVTGALIDVTVETCAGTSPFTPAARFTFGGEPIVTGLSPNYGVPGQTIHILGSNLIANCGGPTPPVIVKFGSTYARSEGGNSSDVVAEVPAAANDIVDVTVESCVDTSATSAASKFRYGGPPPRVTGVSPAVGHGPLGGPGTQVVVTLASADLLCFGAQPQVFFGGVEASVVDYGGSYSITVNAPSHAPGLVDVTVKNCQGTSAATPADWFRYASPETATALTSSPNPATPGQQVSFTAIVSSPGGVPTGTVDFFDGFARIGSSPLGLIAGNSMATFSTSTLSPGPHFIMAVYSGSGNDVTLGFLQSGAELTQSVVAPTQTALASSLNPSNPGQVVTLTATVTSSSGIPTGTVHFFDGTTEVGSSSLTGTSVFNRATVNLSALAPGQHVLTATYGGDAANTANAMFGSSTSLSLTQRVVVTPTITLTSSANPSPAGQAVTFTATITSPAGTPTGTITFLDDSTTIGTSTLAGGTATFTTSALSAGSHGILAQYGGDTAGLFTPASSTRLTQTIGLVTSTALTSSLNPSAPGQQVTLTAVVTSGGSPAGNVVFKDGATDLGTISLTTVAGKRQASLPTTTLAGGAHTIVATYAGDAVFAGSSSPPLTQNVLHPTSTTVTSSSNPVALGQPLTVTAKVLGPTGVGAASGTVAFFDGGNQLGTGTLDGNPNNDIATFTTSSLTTGTHQITAHYGGAATFAASTSSALAQVVSPALVATTVALTSSKNPSNPNDTIAFNTTINHAFGVAIPTGDVVFTDGGVVIGTATVDGNGHANLLSFSLDPGKHFIIAKYQGDTTYSGSTSSTLTQTVFTSTFTGIQALNSPSEFGDAVTFRAVLSPNGPGTPTGSISFSDGINQIGSVPLSVVNGLFEARFTTSTLTPGTHLIGAGYLGDSAFSASTSGSVTQTVNSPPTPPRSIGVVIDSNNSQARVGDTIRFRATLATEMPTPTGVAAFFDGTTQIGSGPIVVSGGQPVAELFISTLAAGSHAITAKYLGDDVYAPSTTSVLTQTVSPALQATATSLAGSPNPAGTGQSVALSVTVTGDGDTPTGTVTLLDGSTVIGSSPLASGHATFAISTLTPGFHTITARYDGDDTYSGSTSAPFGELVKAATSIAITSSTNPAPASADVEVSATVTTSTGVATGTVSFRDDYTIVGTAPLNENSPNVAAINLSGLSIGTHHLTATYDGDGDYAGATSTVVNQVVSPPSTSLALTVGNQSPTYGESETLRAVLDSSATSPSGSVEFFDGTTSLGTRSLSTADNETAATLKIDEPSAGLHTFRAVFAGSDALGSSTAPDVSIVVRKATLTVKANDAAKVYGTTNPPLSATISGFVNGDNASVVSGAPTFISGATNASSVGTYGIYVDAGALSAANYEFVVVAGHIDIAAAQLTVTAHDATRVYGDSNPAFSASVSGFVNGDTSDIVTGSAALSTDAVASSPVGTYPIDVETGTIGAPNYVFDFVPGTLTITPATLTVSAQPALRAYGAPNPPFASIVDGFRNGDASSVVHGSAALSSPAATASGIGAYPIAAAIGTLHADNYTFVLAGSELHVVRAALFVTPAPVSMASGDAVPALPYSMTGFVAGNPSSVVTGAPTLTTTATSSSPAGTYPITATLGTLAAANYDFYFDTGVLTVTPPAARATRIQTAPLVLKLSPLKVTLATASATLTTTSGDPVIGVVVSFKVNSKLACTGTTNSQGKASCSFALDETLQSALKLKYVAVFAGNAGYLASSDASPVIA